MANFVSRGVLVAFASAIFCSVSLAQTIIDNFTDAGASTSDPPGVVRTTVGSTSVTDTGLIGVIGGARTLTVDATAAGGASPQVKAGVNTSFGILAYSSSLLANGATSLFYDANGAGLGADLSLAEGIEITLTTDAAAVPYLVTVTLSDGIVTESDSQAGLMVATTLLQFDFTNFPTVDLANLESIEVAIDPNVAGDLETGGPGILTYGEPICGNGVIEPDIDEVCDDGNLFDGDGCDSDCSISSACTFAHGGTPNELFVGLCGLPTFPTIQLAIAAAAPGDIISVCPGNYFESVIVDEEVTIRSASGAASTTINKGLLGTILFDVRRSGVTIEDLTLVAGTAAAVISANNICGLGEGACGDPGFGSNLTIRDNVIRDGASGINWNAAKVDCLNIDDNVITDVTSAPMRVQNTVGAPSVLVTVTGNTVSGATSNEAMNFSGHGFGFLIAQNTVQDNGGDGIMVSDIAPSVPVALIAENQVENNAGIGIAIEPGAASVRVIQNNIVDNGTGLANSAPEAVVDATLNWWDSQTGPFHATERPAALGDEVVEVGGGLDTTFIEFLCAPAPAGFPSIGGECDDAEPEEEILYIAIGHSPDVSQSGRFIVFVSAEDLNGDARITVDNADESEEAFVLNRKPTQRDGAYCLGGTNPGAACTRQRDCPEDLNADPIVTEGACVLMTQLSHDPSGDGVVQDPRVNRRGETVFAADADLIGQNPDNSLEAVRWSAKLFRRNEAPDPNDAIVPVSVGANTQDSTNPQVDRGARRQPFVSESDLTGDNPDGNAEIFVYDSRLGIYSQVTDSIGIDNRRPSTQTGRQVAFDSEGDYTGQNPDGNREIFVATFRRGGWDIDQMTITTAPVVNFAGSLGKRGNLVVFSSNGDLTGQNPDGNREVFLRDKSGFEQVSMTTVGENVNPTVNTRGRFVTFESTSDADASGTTVTNRRVFLFDRKTGTTRAISRSLFGDNYKPRISNGRFVVWESTSNLTGSNPDANRVIYLYDRRKDN